ncbi:MAG: hypothetical protein IPP14_02625 [Planctomycetes bacterium]|nr:hypothetical protein [Planctomycetota bacterium]
MSLEYLLVPHQYTRSLGGVSWSTLCDAVGYEDGGTLALAPALAQCLEGYGGQERPIHFGFVLHWLHLVCGRDATPALSPLRRSFAHTGGSFRNAGALLAELARPLQRLAGQVVLADVCKLLRAPAQLAEVHFLARAATSPPLSPEAFAGHIQRMLEGFDEVALKHWMRHGRGPVTGPRPRALPPVPPAPPRTLANALDALMQRERLHGVAPFLAQLVSALSLPPRRVQRAQLPVGGYSSVTNRGHPDQILPSEFAVDEFEFLRRFAENELLYWQREEPQSQVREDTIVLLDQGVRTWGETRLVLAAAAMALARRSERRGTPVRFAATSNHGVPVEPGASTEAELGTLLDSTDLSPDPGLALERTLEEPGPSARDIVLLTHPRNLAEPDVLAACRRAMHGTRVFAFTIDESGQAGLHELRKGAVVSLRTFRVEIKPQAAPAQPPASSADPWKGDLSPWPMPFRFGVAGPVRHLSLEAQGAFLAVVTAPGLIQCFSPQGEATQTLPVPMLAGKALRSCVGLVGVTGGLVALFDDHGRSALAHFDFAARQVTTTLLHGGPGSGALAAGYDPTCHRLITTVSPSAANTALKPQGFDLGNQLAHLPATITDLASLSGLAPRANLVHQPRRSDFEARSKGPAQGQWVLLNPTDGRLAVLQPGRTWSPFLPRRDGKPLLKDCQIQEAALAQDTLVIRLSRNAAQGELHFFRGPQWQYLGECAAGSQGRGISLSLDGRLAACCVNQGAVQLFQVGETLETGLQPAPGKLHSQLDLAAGENWFTVYGGKFTHLLRWDRDRLEISFLQGRQEIAEFQRRQRDAAALSPRSVQARSGHADVLRVDASRFQAVAKNAAGITFATDSLGQVAVFSAAAELVAMFFVYRSTVAAWLPDGTCYGPAGVTGGATTQGALQKIGLAMQRAGGGR